jgi:transposase-like protein
MNWDCAVLSTWAANCQTISEQCPIPLPRGHRFPPEIIGDAVWVYHRFCLSFRDVEDLLAALGHAQDTAAGR